MANEFVADNENIYVNSLYAEAYIPQYLFDPEDKEGATAREYGTGFETMGLFNMRFFNTEDYDREKSPIETFNCPTIIETYPTSSTVENVVLNGVSERCRVLKYEKGDIMMKKFLPKGHTSCEKFINLLIAGYIPSTFAYEDVNTIWTTNFDIMGINPGVPDIVKQLIISKLYRNKKNPTEEFALVAGLPGVKPTDYLTLNPRQIVANSSVLAALGFEDFGEQLGASILMSKKNIKQQRSPVEDIILN